VFGDSWYLPLGNQFAANLRPFPLTPALSPGDGAAKGEGAKRAVTCQFRAISQYAEHFVTFAVP
jgi:hypothetical protein